MFKIIGAIFFIIIGAYIIGLYGVGNHGHFGFRFNKLEDWLFWGSAIICFYISIYLFYRFFKLRTCANKEA